MMAMKNEIKAILHNAQQNSSCHQKYLKSLESYYNKVQFEDFVEAFSKYLIHIFHVNITIRNPFVERILEFLAKFVSFLTKPREQDINVSLMEDSTSHPFLTQVIYETLKFHDLASDQARYYSCRFITLILQHIGNETHLDNTICDSIQEAMLERIMDPKVSIRLQAVMALVRLQEPSNPECPVIKAYLSLLMDANSLVRKEVIKRIAPNSITICKISEHTRDVDSHVRMAAYSRCADIGPRLFKIIRRQQIIQSGFKDNNKDVRTYFLEKLFPKWLTAYNGNFIDFISGLKLDADESDIINYEEICKQVMEAFFGTVPIKDIIDVLPINDDKLIPMDKLSTEVVIYWSLVTKFLRDSNEELGFLDDVLCELTPFCHHIQRIIDFKVSKRMDEWEHLEYQYILFNLFDMAEQYDLTDEVGRKALYKLVMSVLQNYKLQFKLAKKIVSIADKLISSADNLTYEICQIISDIREPLVDQLPTAHEDTNKKFQIAELKVKINISQGEIEDALDAKDFQKASVIQNQMVEYKRKLEEFEKQSQISKVKVSKEDPETICRCLDLLIALMQLPSVKVLSSSLATCKTEFLLPLLSSNVVEINWRVLKCISLYCVLDKTIAEEHMKILCIPIITYRTIPNYNKCAIVESIAAICDLLRVYGPKLFDNDEDNGNLSLQHNTTRRRLYRNEVTEDMTLVNHNKMNVEVILEIMLDMLDDENEEIRGTAVTALSKLILNEFPVNSTIMSRLILKWFNPVDKAGDRTQQKLGSLISNYTKIIKDAKEIIKKAVVPIVSGIASAPRTSPLADIEIDNVLQFLAAITNSDYTTDIVHIHTNLASTLCSQVANKPKDCIVPYLTKMLLYLEIPPGNRAPVKELITQAELLLEEEYCVDKGSTRNLKKFVEKLKAGLKQLNTTESIQDLDSVNNNSTQITNDQNAEESTNTEKPKDNSEKLTEIQIENVNDHNKTKDIDKGSSDSDLIVESSSSYSSTSNDSTDQPAKRLKIQLERITSSDELISSVVANDAVLMKDNKSSKENQNGKKKLDSIICGTPKTTDEIVTCTQINKNSNDKGNAIENNESVKRTRRGKPINYRNISKGNICKTNFKSRKESGTDVDIDTSTDMEENINNIVRKSKRQKMLRDKLNEKNNEDTSTDSEILNTRSNNRKSRKQTNSSENDTIDDTPSPTSSENKSPSRNSKRHLKNLKKKSISRRRRNLI